MRGMRRVFRHASRERGEALAGGPIDERYAVERQDVEEERLQRQALPHRGDVELAAEPPHGDLERLRPAVGAQRDRFAVQDRLAHGQPLHRLDDLRYGRGHLVEPAAEHAHLVPGLVHLHARAIELVFERGATERAERIGDIVGGLRQHRPDRPEQLDGEARQPRFGPRRARPWRPCRCRRPSSRRAGRRRPAARLPWRSPRSSGLRARPGAARRAAGGPGNPARRRWRGRRARGAAGRVRRRCPCRGPRGADQARHRDPRG